MKTYQFQQGTTPRLPKEISEDIGFLRSANYKERDFFFWDIIFIKRLRWRFDGDNFRSVLVLVRRVNLDGYEDHILFEYENNKRQNFCIFDTKEGLILRLARTFYSESLPSIPKVGTNNLSVRCTSEMFDKHWKEHFQNQIQDRIIQMILGGSERLEIYNIAGGECATAT